jgi:hypothetical protein
VPNGLWRPLKSCIRLSPPNEKFFV